MEAIKEQQSSLREGKGEGPTDKKLGLGNVYCKMGEGWTCVITKTEGPDAGKVFLKCGENCSCTIDGETVSKEVNLPPEVEIGSGNQAFCKCGEGWSCVIYKTQGPEAGSGKGFAECAAKCSCSTNSSI
ncbi:uncharacterized protein LOC107487199 [Arachis duranensis]|uniref:Uncharacterized protein n=3 Tax=Arachis TaxID=3817 RepID=A0A444WVU4_ARAHY|nr:uncharacterized protein LOC107487199 [Arachis duranensis]XP_025651179.1 uncharacterized protein LOC112747404 [Arachis hypogaea]XP_025697835.1 uncharacterized protein LOC112800018 [Arachis hypogaea]QHO44461.1 uncharacterized protein DS421_5g171240 [Arachis hypogaea]RYQ81543.1 hypothetical protein Ahy_Scaffold1g107437 isoform D [Arachis hypogaea]